MDSNLPAHYWRPMLERAQWRRQKFVKKATWSAEDLVEVEELVEIIQHYEEMLEWCDIRDNDYWSWDQWQAHLEERKKPKVNEVIGVLPIEDIF
jgi:cyclopropane fatty-acyl-phospholipid synthase-like methyltransferase